MHQSKQRYAVVRYHCAYAVLFSPRVPSKTLRAFNSTKDVRWTSPS